MRFNNLIAIKTPMLNLAVAFMYFLSAKSVSTLSLTEGGNVFAVWPPTGVALAALMIFGKRVSIGIFLGALAINYSIVDFYTSLHIAIGNTVGPLFCMYILCRFGCEKNYLSSVENIVAFFLAVLVGSFITATNGVASLVIWGSIPLQVTLWDVWYTWFLGDLVGFVALTPLFLAIKLYYKSLYDVKILELSALTVSALFVAYVVFFAQTRNYPIAYMSLPVILWAVFRFNPLIPILMVNMFSIAAILGTLRGSGPFAGYDAYEALLLLQIYSTVSIVTVLLIVGVMNEREKIKTDLEELNASLKQRIDVEIAKNQKQQSVMAQQGKMVAMGEMMGSIAHQWRQPLNALAIIVQDMRFAQKAGELTGEYMQNMVDKSMEQINFMSKTIDDFRNFFKPDKQKAAFDLFAAVMDSVKLVYAQFKTHAVDIKIRCAECSYENMEYFNPNTVCLNYYVFGYQNEFKQVVLNILSNSKDAIIESRGLNGGVIFIDIERDEDMISVKIADNGGGIPDAIIGRIFEPYFTTKEQGKGTGIGLYMSKMIVEDNMGGKIYCENKEDGAAFTILLNSYKG